MIQPAEACQSEKIILKKARMITFERPDCHLANELDTNPCSPVDKFSSPSQQSLVLLSRTTL